MAATWTFESASSLPNCCKAVPNLTTISNMNPQSPSQGSDDLAKRKTCKRINLPGHAHAFNFSCFRNQAFLSKDRSRQWLISAIVKAQELHHFDLWAYCVMPTHAHLLLWPRRADYDVSMILNSIKQSVAKRARLFVKENAPDFLGRMEDRQANGRICYRFWQRGGGYDRNLFEPKAIYQEIDYIHLNPVRGGLCDRPEDWLWSSAADYTGLRRGPAAVQRESLPFLGQFG
jgi:putative transposase